MTAILSALPAGPRLVLHTILRTSVVTHAKQYMRKLLQMVRMYIVLEVVIGSAITPRINATVPPVIIPTISRIPSKLRNWSHGTMPRISFCRTDHRTTSSHHPVLLLPGAFQTHRTWRILSGCFATFWNRWRPTRYLFGRIRRQKKQHLIWMAQSRDPSELLQTILLIVGEQPAKPKRLVMKPPRWMATIDHNSVELIAKRSLSRSND